MVSSFSCGTWGLFSIHVKPILERNVSCFFCSINFWSHFLRRKEKLWGRNLRNLAMGRKENLTSETHYLLISQSQSLIFLRTEGKKKKWNFLLQKSKDECLVREAKKSIATAHWVPPEKGQTCGKIFNEFFFIFTRLHSLECFEVASKKTEREKVS